MNKEEPLTVKFDKDTQFFHVWHQTSSLRWKHRSNLFGPKTPVLQQMWRSDTGEEKWLDVPEED
jgi:hypothetical protein